jgi:anti-sigma factor RsiW
VKCNEARKLLNPYLDSELDTKSSLEVEQHLASCTECAGLFEAESKFDARVRDALRGGERTPALWDAVESRLHPAHDVISNFRWVLAAAVAVALLAGIWFVRAARPLDLAIAAGECHNTYVQRITSPEFNGPVPDRIVRELGNQLDAAAFDYRPTASGFSADGARFCHVRNVPTAVILGHYENVPVSLLVFKRSELVQFPTTKARLETGEAVVCSHTGRYEFAVRIIDDHVVCVVAETNKETLESLAKSITTKT